MEYETQKDKLNETRAGELLTSLGFTVCTFGKFAPCDFFAFTKKGQYLVEFKKRSHNYGDFPTVMIPEKKLRKCLTIAEQIGCSFLYVVEFDNGTYGCDVKHYTTANGGRTDRNDPNDYGVMAFIDIKDFRRLF
jgi:hypothetical protein